MLARERGEKGEKGGRGKGERGEKGVKGADLMSARIVLLSHYWGRFLKIRAIRLLLLEHVDFVLLVLHLGGHLWVVGSAVNNNRH